MLQSIRYDLDSNIKLDKANESILELINTSSTVKGVFNSKDGSTSTLRLTSYSGKLAAFHEKQKKSIFFINLEDYSDLTVKVSNETKSSPLASWLTDRKYWLHNCHPHLWSHITAIYNNQSLLDEIKSLNEPTVSDIKNICSKYNQVIPNFIGSRKLTLSSLKVSEEVINEVSYCITNKIEKEVEWEGLDGRFHNKIKITFEQNVLRAYLFQYFKRSKDYHLYALISSNNLIYYGKLKRS